MNALLALPVALPLAAAALTVLARGRLPLQRGIAFAAGAGVLATGLALTAITAGGVIPATQVGGWPAGIAIPLVADPLAALLLSVAALMVVASSALAVARGEDAHPLFHTLVLVCSAGVFGAFLTADLFNLFVFFEVMLIASYVLLTLGGGPAQVRAGSIYVPVNLLASTVLLGGIGLLYGVTGTVNLGQLHAVAGSSAGAALAAGVVAVAFAVKACVVPLHAWLPRAYPHASPAVTALFSGLLTKAGVYALYRLYAVVFDGDPSYRPLLLAAAALTMVVGVLGAVGGSDIRGILSFHMVSQVGYLILPLGLFTVAGLTAGIFYFVQYVVVKGSLFLSAGAVETVDGSGRLERLGGMARRWPPLALAFGLAALSLAGIPPLSGFLGKLLLVRAAFEQAEYAAGGVAVAVSLLTLLSMVKIWNGAFWGDDPEPVAPRRAEIEVLVPAGGAGDEAPVGAGRAADGSGAQPAGVAHPRRWALVAPALSLAFLVVALGLWPEPLLSVSDAAAEALVDPSAYLEAVGAP